MPSQGAEKRIKDPVSNLPERDTQCKPYDPAILHVLRGVAVATNAAEHQVSLVADLLAPGADAEARPSARRANQGHDGSTVLSNLQELFDLVSGVTSPPEVRQIASLTVAVTFLHENSRKGLEIAASDLELIWRIIYAALTLPHPTGATLNVSRSAQGFLAVPLCSLLKNGNIDELFRLHVWMPDGQRGEPEFTIHSHQSFAQSWVLAGQGTDRGYEVQVVNDPPLATHAEYALVRNDGKATSTSYKTHQVSLTVKNTHKFVCAKPIRSDIHTRDDTYTIPAATFHTTEVEPDELHATLFYFDSHRGLEPNARRVLGPKDGEHSTQIRDPNGLNAEILAETTNVLRSYERHMRQGQQHSDRSEWEHALKEYDIALSTIRSANLSNRLAYYAHLTLGGFGNANRHLGRYEIAKKYLEQALKEMKPSHALIDISGSLAVIYRQMDLLEEAKRASEVQYETALKLGSEWGVCRALGILGTVNFELYQRSHDENLLKLAIEQQTQRVERARLITASVNAQHTDRKTRAKNAKYSTEQEPMGLARLSICYTALGKLAEAREKAKESLDLTSDSDDPYRNAISHYFYGRALLKSDQKEEALKHFKASTIFSPAHILCQEPSEEHRGYLRELIAAGADIDREDMRGYTPWDYTIFNGDEHQNIIREALRPTLQGDVEQQLAQRQKDANVKKSYRELFQEYLRPVLLKGGDEVFQTLRTLYAEALAIDQEKKTLYDGFKFVWYCDFLEIGRLPRSTDDLTNEYAIGTGASRNSMPESVVFFSYRWINHDPKFSSPDDSQHTQYKRMIAALEEFLKIHPGTDRKKLGIWIVSRSICFHCTVIWTAILTPSTQDLACIDQDNSEPDVRALPLNLAQCNSVITLADQEYESRAWCSVEALLAHTLRNSYHQHTWYEQVPIRVEKDDQPAFILQQGQFNTTIPMSEKRLQFEEVDRPKVVFLERQSHLLAND